MTVWESVSTLLVLQNIFF